MRRLLILVVLSTYACASTYYVSSSVGNDNNNGTSAVTPWKTLASVSTGGAHASLIVPGTTVLLARGDTWRESLIPPASGTSGSPITFDAYGTGAPPEITGYQQLSTWSQASSSVWSTPLTATGMNYVLFGTIWGTKQASQGALAHDRDFYFSSNTLYVFANSNPATYYGTLAAILPLNSPSSDQAIYVNGKQWLVFQHMKLDWFDYFGVNVAGASDHLVFANMESDGMVPAGTLPHGFYVYATSAPSDIQFVNVDASMNYDGLRFDGPLGAASIKNTRGYFNRNYGIDDTTGGHVTYSYCHLYGNGIGVLGASDPMEASGAVSGGNNVASWTAPLVNNFARYPARVSYTIDDEGKSLGGANFIDSVLPQFTSRNLKLSIAVVTGEQYASGDIPRIQGWLNAGHDINSHSWSHNYYDGPTMLTIRYTGTGTAATMTISGNTLTTTVTGGPGGEGLNFDLTNASYSDYTKLVSAIAGRSGYTATLVGLPHGHAVTLANVSGVDIKSATYNVALDPVKFVPDEMSSSASWLTTKLTGLSGSELVYVYPSGKENYQTQLYSAAAGYKGGRGSLSMGQAIAGGFSTNSGPAPLESNVRSVYGYGVNVQNITSLGASNFSGMSAARIGAQVGALVNKAKAWGVPYGLFTHPPETGAPELSANEIGAVLDGLIAAGATVMTNTQLVDYLAGQPQVSGSTMAVSAATGGSIDLRPTLGSASTLKGSNVNASYGLDIQGAKRSTFGTWDVGAYQTSWNTISAPGSASYRTGLVTQAMSENAYCLPGDVANFGTADGPATLPKACVYTAMSGTPSPGAVTTVASNCSNLQSVINAANAGDTIVIPATATCSGAYTLPAKSGADRNHWITIRTDQINNVSFPAEGMRATPCEIGVTHVDGYPDFACANPGVRMPTIIANAINTPAIMVNGNFYRLIGLNVTKTVGVAEGAALIVMDFSDHVVLDRLLIHGVDWSSATKMDTHVGVSTRGTYQALINSWCYDIDWKQPDGQCVAGGTEPQLDEGPTKLDNNLMAGSSETWEFGGAAAAAVPHDYEIRNNLSMKPLKWMFAEGATTYNVSPNVKNLGEWKQGDRTLMEYNVFMNDWEGQSDQFGHAIVMMPKSQAYSNTNKFVNVNGISVSCASDASGTPCAAGTGVWGNAITSIQRTNGYVTLHGATSNGWPYYWAGYHIWLQGIPSQVVNGVNLNIFNGEWTMGCSDATETICTDGYDTPGVLYFYSAGPDIPLTSTSGLATDAVVQTCGIKGHCMFDAPNAIYPTNLITSVIDSEHITVQNAYAPANGLTQVSCHQGQTPHAEVMDFTARYNYITHAENIGFTIGNVISSCQDAAAGVGRISIHDDVADDIDTTSWTNTHGCCGHGGAGPDIQNGVATVTAPHDVLFAHNTWAGLRGWPLPSSNFEAGFSFTDNFNGTHNGTTVLRVSNLVTITYNTLSGAAQGTSVIISGFTGGYADLNGTWTVLGASNNQVTFLESGTNTDISPAMTISAGTTGAAKVNYPISYFANITWRDNIFPGPLRAGNYGSSEVTGGLTAGLALNFCQSGTCTWSLKNNVIGTALYANYSQTSGAPYPTTNPDSSATNFTLVSDFSGVFTNWNTGVGNTWANDYHVTAAYKNAGSDGRDIGADMTKVAPLLAGVPQFTYYPLVISTTSLTPCTIGTYCEQQLLTSSSASTNTPNGFVRWKLTSGTLPAGMSLANGEGYSTCQVNGSYSKTGSTGCQGWVWGTPTQSGTFPLTFTVEDGAHQTASMSLALVVN